MLHKRLQIYRKPWYTVVMDTFDEKENQVLPYAALCIKRTVAVTSLYSLHYFAYIKQFRFMGERHGFYELIYCDSGEAVIHDEDKAYTLKQGDLFLHAPNHYHDVSTGDLFTNVTVIGFDGAIDGGEKIAGKVIGTDATQKAALKAIVMEGRENLVEPLNLVYQSELKPNKTIGAAALEKAAVLIELLLLSLLAGNNETVEKPDKSRNYHESVSQQIVALLKENLSESIRLSDVSARFGFSTPYLKRIFSSCMGMGIIQYFNTLKIEKAKQLMSESTLSVSQISEQLGFSSLQYFSRQFRHNTNMSPTQYLNSIKLTSVL